MIRLFISLCLGYVLGLCNLYSALRVGFTVGVGLVTVLCWAALDRVLARWFPRWEQGDPIAYACTLSLTSAMSYGSATVIATALAAALLDGADPPVWAMVAWVAGMCCLGSCFALPLSEGMLARYPFPSGQAAGQMVQGLRGERGGAFFPTFGLAGLWVGLRSYLGWPDQLTWGQRPVLALSPLLIGLGALLGPTLTLSMLGGALVFEVLVPEIALAWMPQRLWFAIGMIMAATLVAFAAPRQRGAPAAGWTGFGKITGELGLGLGLGLVLLILAYASGWRISPWWLIVLVPLQVLFAYIAGASTGQTDVVPTGALGKLAILFFSFSGQGNVMVHTGTLAGAAAASADFLTDLRCGRALGCPPKVQFRFQLLGALIGPILFVPSFLWWTRGQLGEAAFPVPAARIWLGVAGLHDALSTHGPAILAGALVGLLAQALTTGLPKRVWLPQALPFAMAAMLDLATCAALTLGALVGLIARADRDKALFCALICGEAVVAVFLNF